MWLVDGGPPEQNLAQRFTVFEFQKSTTLGPIPIDGLAWMTAKSVRLSLWSSKTDAEKFGLCLHPEMVNLFAFQTKLHKNIRELH